MLTIYGGYNYPPIFNGILRDLRVIWAAEELGIPYRIHWLDAARAEHKGPANRAVNPFGKIPSVEDGDTHLFESGAILNYLFAKAGKEPADGAARILSDQWSFAAVNTVEQPMDEIFRWDVLWREREGRDKRRAEVVEAAVTRLGELDDALGDREFLVGDALSPADILMATSIRFARTEPGIYAKAPRVKAYVDRLEARPAFQRAEAQQGKGP